MNTQIQGTGSVTVEDVYSKLKEGEPLSKKMAYSHPEKTDNKSVRISLGRIWFNAFSILFEVVFHFDP